MTTHIMSGDRRPVTNCTDPGCAWRPLELLLGDVICGDFMHMGAVDSPDGLGLVELFKHSDTRRYVNLSVAGDEVRAWAYVGERGYRRVSMLAAVAHALELADESAALALFPWIGAR